jgi:DNA-binding LytR/AlgR family response regulator
MIRNKFYIILFSITFYFTLQINCQNVILDNAINSLKEYNLDKTKETLNRLNSPSKLIIKNWLDYYQNGKKLELINIKDDYSLSRLYLGDYFLNKKQQDSTAFKHYLKAKINSFLLKDTLLINESLRRICELQIKFRNHTLYKETLDLLNSYKKDSIDFFYVNYFKTANVFFNKNKNEKPNFNFNTYNNKYLKAKLLNIKGVYYSRINDYKNAIKSYEKAILNFENYDSHYTDFLISGIKFNIAIIQYKSKNYKKAISSFKKLLKEDFKNDILRQKSINLWLYRCYDSIKKLEKALKYLKESIRLNEKLNSSEHSKFILNKEHQLKLYDKKKALENQIQKNQVLKSKNQTILIILSTVLLLLALVYFLYKKHYKKSKSLEVEKLETIKKIDELKQIVIKNHIVLKDKTKIYVADLLYIKSDDHYLKIFLSNGKNHFVRGKLAQVIEELPPNFIRTHRSFVVNRNFIKQINNTNVFMTDGTEIPLSRIFKKRL